MTEPVERQLRPLHLVIGVAAALLVGVALVAGIGRLAGFGDIRRTISGGDVQVNLWALIAKCATLTAYSTNVAGRMTATQRSLAERALPLFQAGKLRAPATERLALADAVAAHERLASREVVGRLVLVP